MMIRGLASLLLFSLFSLPTFAQASFSKQVLSTGSDPVDVVIGDVNHDGIPDIIDIDKTDNAISVRLGNGDGTFQNRSTYAVGAGPVAGSTADFQKDGKVDFVTVNKDASTVSILIGNGDGTFQTHKDIAVGSHPNSVVAGDFNGDGKTDIATADYDSNTISILPGNGDGTFGQRITLQAGTQHPEELVKGDFNGDGKLDLLYADCCQGTDVAMDTLHVKFNQGNFNFNDVTSFGLSVPVAISVGKINGDAKDDLAISYEGCHTPCEGVSVYTSNGDGTFAGKGAITISTLYWSLPTNPVLADFNGDGRIDVAVGVKCCGDGGYPNTQDAVLVALQNSGGGFNTPSTTYIGANNSPSSLGTGDLNGDKKPDLVVTGMASNSLIILMNTTSSTSACSSPTSAGVHICSPGPNSTVDSPVTISAAAKGSTTISRMEVWIDGVKKYQANGSTLETSMALSDGNHRLVVEGIESNGTVLKEVEYFTVSTSTSSGCSDPSSTGVHICSPAANSTVSSPVTISAAAKGSTSISHMEVWIDGVKKYQVSGSGVNTSIALGSGTHRLVVEGVESNGTVLKTVEYFTVSSSGGSCSSPGTAGVNICSPAANSTVGSPVTITAAATGSTSISHMEVWIDHVKKYQVSGSTVNTSISLGSGTHRLVVEGVQSNGTVVKGVEYFSVS